MGPLISKRPDFKEICKKYKLQARGGDTWDMSNADRLGVGEVELVNRMITGCNELIQLEMKLEAGESI